MLWFFSLVFSCQYEHSTMLSFVFCTFSCQNKQCWVFIESNALTLDVDLFRTKLHYTAKRPRHFIHTSGVEKDALWGPPGASHYDDVIMTTIASQITSLTVVYSIVYSDADERKHQSSASLAFVWGIHRDRWIPGTKDQLRGKCFHLMTSSCFY